jgi:hypothetical protein
MTNTISDGLLERAIAFYETSPDGQYDREAVSALRELQQARLSLTASGDAVIGACAHLQMASGSNAEWRAHEALKLLQSILPKGDEKTGQPKPLWPNDSDRWGDPE